MKFVSLLPARGGSKGIPLKNSRLLKGKPLIQYTIEASLGSAVDETYVSTDCENIKRISLECGALVIDRPHELAQDNSQSEEALLHFASKIDFDYLVFIQPTSPLLEAQYINTGVDLLKEGVVDSVFSASECHWIPAWTKTIEPIEWDIYSRPLRQQKPPYYIENGAFYITSRHQLLSTGLRYSGKIKVVEMPLSKSFQIDTLDDFNLIEKLLP